MPNGTKKSVSCDRQKPNNTELFNTMCKDNVFGESPRLRNGEKYWIYVEKDNKHLIVTARFSFCIEPTYGVLQFDAQAYERNQSIEKVGGIRK